MYRHFDGMCWPCPGEDMSNVIRALVYGEPRREDLLLAASVLQAYEQLISVPAKRRAELVREIRLGPSKKALPNAKLNGPQGPHER